MQQTTREPQNISNIFSSSLCYSSESRMTHVLFTIVVFFWVQWDPTCVVLCLFGYSGVQLVLCCVCLGTVGSNLCCVVFVWVQWGPTCVVLCLFGYSVVQLVLCCVCLGTVGSNLCCVVFWFVFLCPVYPMLQVSLGCPLLIAPSVFSNKLFDINIRMRI